MFKPNQAQQRILACTVRLAAALVVAFVLNYAALADLPDCDGSTPAGATACGTAQACANSSWSLSQPNCTGSEIIRQNIQWQCNSPTGQGSTLCGGTGVDLTCTTRKTCQLATMVTFIEGPDGQPYQITLYRCEGQGVAQQNSVQEKVDYITCRDTSGT